ncbi:hypothetical protein LJR034_002630 [Caballeronia sp. LjRoot34]|uniref:hypothetical protein n=1 Tax=Caballeronia sp. LjRoot34 TaxID=3342325 RepID=UPI003ECE3B4C
MTETLLAAVDNFPIGHIPETVPVSAHELAAAFHALDNLQAFYAALTAVPTDDCATRKMIDERIVAGHHELCGVLERMTGVL